MPNRVSKTEIKETLDAIYRDGGAKIDMQVKRIKPKKRSVLVGLIVFFGLVSAVSWLGIIFFSHFGSGGSDNVKINILGGQKVTAGEEVQYEIKYKNNESFPLASSEVGLYLPKNFVLTSSDPLLDDKNSLIIGTLGVGQEGSIKFKGKFFAAEGDKLQLQAVLTYKPSNFNSNFEKAGNLEVEIGGSVFDGSLDAPDKLTVGDTATYKLTYKNKSGEQLDNVAIDAVLPAGLVVTTSTPAIDKNNRWNIGQLAAGQDGAVQIQGIFSSDTKGPEDIIMRLGIIEQDGTFLTLIEKKATTEVVGGDLILSVMANGVKDDGSVGWGAPINYSITYKNQGTDPLYNVKLSMNITGTPREQGRTIVDWSTLNDANGGKIQGDTVVWTKDQIADLAKIKPGDEKTIDFSVNIIPKPQSPSYRDYKIDGALSAEIERAGNVLVRRNLAAAPATVFVVSDAAFTSQARYYDQNNGAVGLGPLPPKVGQETTVRVYWKIVNSMHDLENVSVSGNLPDGVVFSSPSDDAGDVALDPSFKKVVWSLNLMPTSVPSLSAQFNLTVKPQASDAGKIMNLLQGITFTATDKSTGGIITLSVGDETTALSDDPYVTPGGKVQN